MVLIELTAMDCNGIYLSDLLRHNTICVNSSVYLNTELKEMSYLLQQIVCSNNGKCRILCTNCLMDRLPLHCTVGIVCEKLIQDVDLLCVSVNPKCTDIRNCSIEMLLFLYPLIFKYTSSV